MPAQELAQANPPPDPSLLPEYVLDLKTVIPNQNVLSPAELSAVQQFRRAADYIAAAMIFLKSNTLIDRPITPDDIKNRLLGHWGTCPGLTLVYAHTNRLIRKTGQEALLVVGPGHGAPAILASLWLENSLSTFWPRYTGDRQGLHNLISGFSTPGGFPSHINAETPGSIHEGGELGYALSVSFGAVMDKPDLVVVCVVGDGEAETGPTATAWHAAKYIDPAESGAVIPIVHVNGFKISERTIYGTMDDKELTALFSGYGYQVRFVEDLQNIDQDLAASMEWALDEIHKIQKAARSGHPIVKPRWPVLIMRTPKGWTGVKTLHGEYIEGSFRSHQVPLPEAKHDKEELALLQQWLESYKPKELFDADGKPNEAILSIIPEADDLKLGQKKEGYAAYTPLEVPDWKDTAVEKGSMQSCMKVVGSFLRIVSDANPSAFRIFSPDELVSNKLDALLDGPKHGRNFQWDVASRAKGGRVIEMLSEHTCQGMLQGYTLTGRTGLFPSYEAFLGIVHTMMHCIAGASVWKFASTDDGVNPDVVLVGIGVEVTFEVIAAAALLRKILPALRVRVVNVTDLMILSPFGSHPHALQDTDWNALFTSDRPVHFNYHGYPNELKGLVFGRKGLDKITMEGYREEGTTTSALDMMLQNHTSRYHVAAAAVRAATSAKVNPAIDVDAHSTITYIMHLAEKDKEYIYKTGADPEGTFDVPTFV
ncbi:hypothetical protein EIP91_010418 [Steccherinum ochraceum]|uniref:Phosphoketolase n=1 Tax=Steccherinum ochraceum TaxID=92696 RepID=A0A4V2MUX9_9APHY|nr:hypothetical protein EIP91_010418 [Steccherinum ochraceum]